MLILDGFSESLLFQCDGCRRVGQRTTELVEEEGRVLCWSCLFEANRQDRPKPLLKGKVCC